MKILKVNSSANTNQSRSRELTSKLAEKLASLSDGTIIERDLTKGLSFINNEMLQVYYTPENELSAAERVILEPSDKLVNELISSDIIVFGVPMYNFGIPGTLKTYIDQICRLGKTFATNPTGFEGLLKDKTAYIVITTGGTPINGPDDFITAYLRRVLNFIGITNMHFFALDKFDKAEAAQQKQFIFEQIDQLTLATISGDK